MNRVIAQKIAEAVLNRVIAQKVAETLSNEGQKIVVDIRSTEWRVDGKKNDC